MTTTMNTGAASLLPCPFCGGAAYIEQPGTRRQSCIVECGSCGLRHESGDEGAMCGTSWNRRATPQADAAPSGVSDGLSKLIAAAADCISEAVTFEQDGFDTAPMPATQWDYNADQLAYALRAELAAIAAGGAQEPLRLTADDADMVWADDDGESMFHSIDGAVDCIVDLNWPDTTPVEVTFQIAKRLPNASIRIFNITESGHEWEIVAVPDAASNGEQA